MIYNRLKNLIEENKLMQEKLASNLKVVKGTGNCAKTLIATPFLYTICKKYKISADYLLGKIDESKYF